ncbi:MAG TPA: type I-C CRISPR-associated endonuclease Cas1c [Phycisphaerales bacterium]|nr:type I-C CRISPR-associated endonuclease Cas1c [Phycisphaerales bacterium]HRQ76828.1 type I-C CRISPR-associated endonuclease Cas1c [Phycisphaerales bacterium]
MKHHLNTLFVTTQGAYLRKEGEAVVVRIDGQTKLRVPLHHLGGICCFGRVACSPHLMGRCAEAGIAISFLSENGRLQARVLGFTPGNVLLRREQYRRADDFTNSNGRLTGCAAVVRPIVTAKLLNSRAVLLRGIRDYSESPGRDNLDAAAMALAATLKMAEFETDVDRLRGMEGDGANSYFRALQYLVTRDDSAWQFAGRSRRPPRDPMNCLLSFLYTLLMHDARSACEAAGLDSQVGFLHRDRPGRASLALDLMEELRAFLCDRLALSLINRQQVNASGFETTEAGGVMMNDQTRKIVLTAYQKRKQEELTHPFLDEKVSIGLIVHLQARLLARHLRGDLDLYPPFIWK